MFDVSNACIFQWLCSGIIATVLHGSFNNRVSIYYVRSKRFILHSQFYCLGLVVPRELLQWFSIFLGNTRFYGCWLLPSKLDASLFGTNCCSSKASSIKLFVHVFVDGNLHIFQNRAFSYISYVEKNFIFLVESIANWNRKSMAVFKCVRYDLREQCGVGGCAKINSRFNAPTIWYGSFS